MLPVILLICGAGLVLAGTGMLLSWVGGRAGRFTPEFLLPTGRRKSDRQMLDLYYIVTVVLPLLSGAVMIVLALKYWL